MSARYGPRPFGFNGLKIKAIPEMKTPHLGEDVGFVFELRFKRVSLQGTT